MAKFQEALQINDLLDLGNRGHKYTWRLGNHNFNLIQECLDRAIAMLNWTFLFPRALLRHLLFMSSDHRPLLHLQDDQPTVPRLIIKKYEKWWSEADGHGQSVQQFWNQHIAQVERDGWHQVTGRFLTKMYHWSRANGGSLATQIQSTWAALKQADDDQNHAETARLQNHLEDLLKKEEDC